MTPHRASNRGQGGGGEGGGGSYAPYGDSPYGPTAPKHSVRRGGQRSSLGPQVPETMHRAFDNNVGAHQITRFAPPSTSSAVYPPRGPNSPYMVDRMYDWSLYSHDRNHGNDLATLRKKHAALEAKLQAREREGRPYDETDGENAQAIVFLMEIESDIARLEEREGRNGGGKVRDDGRGGEERTGSMGIKQKKSHAGGRARQDAQGHGGFFELPKRSSNPAAAARQAGSHLNGSGHISRHGMMTEEDGIAPITQGFSRLGLEPRERSGKTPRPPRRHDFEDHADQASAGHRGFSELPKRSSNPAAAVRKAGKRHLDGSEHAPRHQMMTEEDDIAPPTRDFSRLGVRSREHGKTPRPARQHNFEDFHADEAPDYHQPCRSLSGRHQPSAGHGGSSSGRFADHEHRAPSRRQNPEDYAAGESDYHQPRGSRHGRHVPPTSGHGRSSSDRFAADHYSSR